MALGLLFGFFINVVDDLFFAAALYKDNDSNGKKMFAFTLATFSLFIPILSLLARSNTGRFKTKTDNLRQFGVMSAGVVTTAVFALMIGAMIF